MSREPSRRFVELAVCESCGRVWRPAPYAAARVCPRCFVASLPPPPRPAESWRGTRECETCGAIFRTSVYSPAAYCPECRRIRYNENHRQAYYRRKKAK